jgi:hypothetical protein
MVALIANTDLSTISTVSGKGIGDMALHPARLKGFFAEKREIEKTAIIGAAAIGHLALNAGYKLAPKIAPKWWGEHEKGQVGTGIKHGLENRDLTPSGRALPTLLAGPESVINYDMGNQIGTHIRGNSKWKQKRQLKKMRKTIAVTPHVRDAPGFHQTIGGINRALDPKFNPSNSLNFGSSLPTAVRGTPIHPLDKFFSHAAPVALGAAFPELGAHMLVNAARRVGGTSTWGKRIMQRGAQKGLAGVSSNPVLSAATDYGISPAVRNPRLMGEAVSKAMQTDPKAARRFVLSGAGQVVDSNQGLKEHVRRQVSGPMRGTAESILRTPLPDNPNAAAATARSTAAAAASPSTLATGASLAHPDLANPLVKRLKHLAANPHQSTLGASISKAEALRQMRGNAIAAARRSVPRLRP